MKDETVLKATGRRANEWFSLIDYEGFSDKSHRLIARRLAEEPGVSQWWSQELTLLYEKRIGRRITGQTADGLYQMGLNRTIPFSSSALWAFLESPEGIKVLVGGNESGSSTLDSLESLNGIGETGIRAETTIYKHHSHLRMKWTFPGWDSYSILQIRVLSKGLHKSVLSFHQEKIPDSAARTMMKDHWVKAFEMISVSMTES